MVQAPANGIVILDEIDVAVHLDVVDAEAVLELMDAKPENVDLVLTGRYTNALSNREYASLRDT